MNKRLAKIIRPRLGVFFLAFLAFSVLCFRYSKGLSIVGVVVSVALYAAYRVLEHQRKQEISRYLEGLTINMDEATQDTLTNFPLPALVALATSGEIIWCNELFEEETGFHDAALTMKVGSLATGFDTRWIQEGKQRYPGEIQIGNRFFTVFGNLMRADQGAGALLMLYLVDASEAVQLRQSYETTRPVVSIIAIDNYEELMKNATDSEKSAILAEIDKKISGWTSDSYALLRKYDRDKYIFVLEERALDKLIEKKFTVLDDVRTLQSRDGIHATLSVGIGKDAETFDEKYRFAQLALEMALSRGGDQAVVRNKYTFEFYGGRAQEVEKRTKVKSRVVANALSQLIRDSSQVLIMGHQTSDNDAIGAAVGMACAVRSREKPVHIVVNSERSMAGDMLKKIQAVPQYKETFISAEEAMVICDFNTLLIVVDTNRPDYVESPPLLASINKVAVIDHHRRAADYIEDCALSMHEPYASSACELVAELLQYMVPNRTILRAEAECMLAGIYLDTKGFSVKAGVRTFEASAYLKRAGADMVEVKKLFQYSFDDYMTRERIISEAKPVGDGIVVAAADTETSRVIASQAADSLLDIIGVRASIVIFRCGEDAILSARSLGKVNVQVIMEKLGGGGSLSAAGAQLVGVSVTEGARRVHEAIRDYINENESKIDGATQ